MQVTSTDVGQWYEHADDHTPHFLVRASEYYGRAACGDVIKVGELVKKSTTKGVKNACPRCLTAIGQVQIPDGIDDPREYLVNHLLAALPRPLPPAWVQITEHAHVPRYVGEEEAEQAGGRVKLPKHQRTGHSGRKQLASLKSEGEAMPRSPKRTDTPTPETPAEAPTAPTPTGACRVPNCNAPMDKFHKKDGLCDPHYMMDWGRSPEKYPGIMPLPWPPTRDPKKKGAK